MPSSSQKKRRDKKKAAATDEAEEADNAHLAQSEAATIASLTPAPIPPVVAVPAGSTVPPALALPVLQLPAREDEQRCLTRPPPQLPPKLVASGFEDASGKDALQPAVIGEGAYASVRRLRHNPSGDVVALKIVEKQPLIIRDMLPQLTRELRIQGALQHRHILRLLSTFEDELYVYLLLEYCGGGTLRSLCEAEDSRRLSESVAAGHFFQILQGVAFMHQCGCVHRDLKPENILLTAPNCEVRICDFGWSAEVTVERALLTACGTPNYWAPEQFERSPQGFHTDIWALGNLLYEILVGHAPFWGSQAEIQQKVLAVDVRFPPGLLCQDAMHLIHCHLQLAPAARAPAAWTLSHHAWLEHPRHRAQQQLQLWESQELPNENGQCEQGPVQEEQRPTPETEHASLAGADQQPLEQPAEDEAERVASTADGKKEAPASQKGDAENESILMWVTSV
eukprot:TRINITY_DN68193_c0_g1_i1.p1 TRINITY_DN68193_c0_g1~~TRINITY_DN68193_c0_g1_i1.p1  ORF type:complete len:453 (-),score=89.36 TRINITY_DN68193_c0_g1_i1:61-1419(-)